MSGTAEKSPFVAFERTAFEYGGGSVVFSELDLTIRPGEYVALLGGNGSGKSTIAKLIDALLLPSSGRVLVFGCDTRDGAHIFYIRSNIGLVFQNPDDQLVTSIIEDEVAFGPENLGIETDELRVRVSEALRAVGMEGFERQDINALSGGQKQRVAIAGALAMRPAMMVFDEATAMLDPRGRRSLMRLIDELHKSGITIVTITHYMDEAARAERVVALEATEAGTRVALDGPPDDVLARADELRALDLAVPFTCELALHLRERGVPVIPTVHEDALVDELVRLRTTEPEGTAPLATPGKTTPRDARQDPGVAEGAVPSGSSQDDALIRFEGASYSYENHEDPATAKEREGSPDRTDGSKGGWGKGPGASFALRDVNLTVGKGEMLGLAGHTGSGKSTLIQHMNGLLHPQSGRVLLDGHDLADKAVAREARRHVGLVFQYPEHQLFAATVYDDVAFGPRNLGFSAEKVESAVRRALHQVGLDPDRFASRNPFELSGGQQRKAALAGVLAMDPQVLVLDEPAAGLDPRTRREFLALLEELHEGGLTVVIASHFMEDLAQLCDRIAVLDEGRVALVGTPLKVFEDEGRLRRSGLARPAPLAAAQLLRSHGFSLPTRLYTAASLADALAPQLSAAQESATGSNG